MSTAPVLGAVWTFSGLCLEIFKTIVDLLDRIYVTGFGKNLTVLKEGQIWRFGGSAKRVEGVLDAASASYPLL
jgi:hypothetical protein